MAHLTADKHHDISFDDTTTGVVKRRVGDTVVIEARVTADYDDVHVEARTALHDREHTQSHSLKHVDENLYQTKITCEDIGKYPVRIRAKQPDDKAWTWANKRSNPACTVHVDPAYTYDAITYNAFVRYFGARSVEDEGSIRQIEPGTFGDITEHVQRLDDMGVDILYLNPVHQIGELYKNYNPHDTLPEYLQPGCPYSVKDYRSIDPELSFGLDDEDTDEHPFDEFRRLVDAAHDHDIRVYMDLVFNHCAHDSVFQRLHPEWFLYKEDPWSLDEPYIHPEEIHDGKPWGDPEHTMSPYDHEHWWKDAAQLNWNNLDDIPDEAFHGNDPYGKAPNDPPENPTIDDMYEYFKNIVKFWIKEFGIDGFRCDVAYRVPTDFWEECIEEARKTAKQAHPENGSVDGDVVFIAEDYHVKCQELLEAGFTACFGDYSNKLGSVADVKGYLDYMYNVDEDVLPDGSQWFIFPECHDFHRNPTKIAEAFRDEHRDADLNANKSRWTLTATLPGIPMIFNGFEKLEWEPASLFSYSKIDWEQDKDITKHIKDINKIRHDEPALRRGDYTYLPVDVGVEQTSIFSFAREHGEETIIVAVNLDVNHEAAATIHTDAVSIGGDYVLRELQTGEAYDRSGDELYVSLPPGEAHVFKVTC
jgi:glycosidase